MSALQATLETWVPQSESEREWVLLSAASPQLAATMGRYLTQLGTFLAPRSVEAADNTLRQLARWLVAETDVTIVAGITRTHIEDYKVLVGRPTRQRRSEPGQEHPAPAPPHDPHLLRAAHRVGLGRRPTTQSASSTATSRRGPIRSRSS